MSELLAPAGSMESLKAAIANGCDAVYLGMQRFGARAYSSNFDERSLEEAVAYAHIRGVKIYVTTNTIVFEDELPAVYEQLHFLNDAGVDGVIAQDIAVLKYVAQHFADMEVHCSTQMGIDDVEGAKLCKELGAKRVVLAREIDVETAKEIRRQAGVPVEVFVHGALCVSYSGNCIMSAMTGNRSGNRGRCIGSCRKLYDVVEVGKQEKLLGRNYILSTKDLNTVDYVHKLKGIDSLKIEGRMKEPVYVANVVSRYRMALDGKATPADKEKLTRTFNRTYTKGYLFHEDRLDITNVEKPNHFGYRIGTISGFRKGMCEASLVSELRQNDVIRIRHGNDDVNLAVARLYDRNGRLVSNANKVCYIKVRESLAVGDVVYKTKDIAYEKELESRLAGEFRRFPLNFAVYAYPGAPLVVDAEGLGCRCTYESDELLSETLSKPTTKDAVEKQLARLNDTVFFLGRVDYDDCGAFIPAKLLNAARKNVVERLYAQKLASKPRRLKGEGLAKGVDCCTFAGRDCAEVEVEVRCEGSGEDSIEVKRAFSSERTDFGEAAERAAASFGTALTAREQANMPSFGSADSHHMSNTPYLCALATTQEQYDACKECGLETVYFRNVVSRNSARYEAREGELLVGGMGGIYRYRHENPFVTDYSLNVVNSESCYEMHRLGAKRVTLSYEINEQQLRDLLAAYRGTYGSNPALEMIVYGRAPLLVTKYCPLKKMSQCGLCRTKRFEIRDEFGSFPILPHENCDTTILNGKVLNLLDEMPRIKGVEAFRLNFTLETSDEVREVIAKAQAKLDGRLERSVFNPKTDTRGSFNKEIL